ncbi:MAG TPA: HipA N-terminal domain-containing protein [Balneolaceae bacterium]
MSYRTAHIFVDEQRAGILEETEEGYRFQYRDEYLNKRDTEPVSLTLPKRKEAYESNILFPFFDGLIPEGWLLNVVEQTWKVNARDRMGLLLVSCRDTIGNVSIRDPEEQENE